MGDSAVIDCHLLETDLLVPDAWAQMRGLAVSAFNPSLLPTPEGYVMAYRVVGPDGHRRIAMCRLDRWFRIIEGSPVPFSDGITLPSTDDESPPRRWFADPRLYVLNGMHTLHWNTGWQEPRNHQLLQAFDPQTLHPIGASRLLVLDGTRQAIEKNWLFLEDAPGFAVYSASPHRVMRYELTDDGPIICADAVTVNADLGAFTDTYGPLRGGAPPVRVGGPYWSVCHTVSTPQGHVRPRYQAAVYAFAQHPPFAPLRVPIRPLPLGNPFGARTRHARLNRAVGEIVYPTGAAFIDGHFVISYGINDEHCAIARIPYETAVATTIALPGG